MTPAPYTVQPTMAAEVARRLMESRRIRHLPVIENKRVVGLVSASTFRGTTVGAHTPVADVMTKEVLTVASTAPVAEVARRMAQTKRELVLVVDNDRIVGIFTTIDALDLLAGVLEGGTSSEAA